MRRIYFRILFLKECSDKTIKNKTLNVFVKECIQEFINGLSKEKENLTEDNNNLETTYIQSFYGPPVNIMIKLVIDSRLISNVNDNETFNIKEFTQINNNTLVLENYNKQKNKMEKSVGCSYRFIVSGTKEDLFYTFDAYSSEYKENIAKMKDLLFQSISNERSTIFWQLLDHFLLYEVKLAPYDRLGNIEGKLVARDTLKKKNHIVYIARDENDNVRYIGEGKPDRYEHVNSGVSHVLELNREYFAGREMKVEIYNENLTKSEALAIERFLLNKYKKCGLWNKKDYEQ